MRLSRPPLQFKTTQADGSSALTTRPCANQMRKSIHSTAGKMKREVHQSPVTSHRSLHLAAEDLILRAEGHAVNKVFYLSEGAKCSRKDKTKILAQNLKTAGA